MWFHMVLQMWCDWFTILIVATNLELRWIWISSGTHGRNMSILGDDRILAALVQKENLLIPIPKLVSWQVLRSLWCLEKRAMTGHSCGYGFCQIWGCELNWIGFVSKWTMWLFWKVAQDTGSKFFPKTVPQCNSMNETHSGVYCPAWGCARHLIAVVSNCIVGLF